MKFAYMPDTHFGVYDQAAPSPEEAADAFEQVIEEAVFDRIELSHAAALFDMAFKICDIISTDEALAQIAAEAPARRAAA